MDFTTKLNQLITRVEASLDQLVPAHVGTEPGPVRIHAAMRYTLQAGGKRLRPVLALSAAELFQPQASALPAAVALECIHTYSLVHDDLPCMDNDDLRRGRPTAHKQFDEATALLAGDGLLTHAFLILATHYAADPRLVTALVRELADAAGSARLVGGQMQDLLAEKKSDATAAELDFIHLNKTAAMLEASLVMGGLVGGADEATLSGLRTAGRHLGLAFQIIDDVLDATADSATLGKTAGKDAKSGKTTYVSLHGIDAARRMAKDQTEAALAAIRALPGDTSFLLQLAESMLRRSK
ncbi:polyprenyl synthetase family protein [Rariglobus hedericola]|uniref:Polyprenyl synthetase family protein n=1 Tax=Rariglobus hedericola TaxID=2597822 RepID=A0A556QQ09_9BACT|nr:farnesyl diphosphate synthase [Rariglobus hedericola]TSJ78728.1 polyprenyl synthetase family protein [Rariglobus hedericola]